MNGFFLPPPDVSKYITHPAAVQEGARKKTSPWITDQLFFQGGPDLAAAAAAATPASTRREEGEKVLVCPQQCTYTRGKVQQNPEYSREALPRPR